MADRNPNEKNESNIRDPWDNIKWANLCLMGIPEEEERERRIESVFEEIMAKNSSNLKRETDIQVQEKQRVSHKAYTKPYYK